MIKVFKVSSSDINNVPLLKKFHQKNTILSTGASTLDEIKFALRILNYQKAKFVLCIVLNYPTEDKFVNLKLYKL